MRDFLLKMYAYMRRLPVEHRLHAATAVALAMLGADDRLAAADALIPGGLQPDVLSPSLLDIDCNPAVAIGAAMALQRQSDGSVVVVPVPERQAQGMDFPMVLMIASGMRLPVVFLVEYGQEFPDDLDAQIPIDDIERIQTDDSDAMRLMPALRLAIDKAREGDGPTLIECVKGELSEETPAMRLADVLITEGYATPEELQ